MKKFLLLNFILYCFLVTACAKSKPNILFVLLDDMGKEWVSGYGADSINTPTIDKLGEEGIVFNNAYSMPQCTPSRVALLTGQYPWRNGWINHYDVPRWGHGARFDPELNPSYAKELQKLGYKTCIAGKWQINDFRLEPNILNEVGFNEYCMWTGYEAGNPASSERYWDPYIFTKEGSAMQKGKFGEDIFTDFIIDFMKLNKEDPFMVYYAMCLPHGPYVKTPNELNVKTKDDKFKAMVRYTDFILDKLLNSLEELGLRENTIIVWTTDNGTAGNITGIRNGNSVQGGKTLLTENGINAPFIVNCPGMVPATESDAIIDFTDLYPTFVELAGGEVSNEYVIDGVSFANTITGKSVSTNKNFIQALGSRPAFIKNNKVENAFEYRDRVLRNETHKVYVNTSAEMYALYNLNNDPWELNNLINHKDAGTVQIVNDFKTALNGIPKKDNNPIYKIGKFNGNDIDTIQHNNEANTFRNKPNRR